MNPHQGQFRLGGTISAWTRLSSPTVQQRRILRRAYRGLDPRVYGRYGVCQWSAPLPWTRVIVKDPFAQLSMETIVGATGALPVVVYRHPGAILTSYRRMGWRPDIEELASVAPKFGRLDDEGAADEVDRMAWFWTVCHRIALEQLTRLPMAVVISHQELSLVAPPAVRTVFDACGLTWSNRVDEEIARWSESTAVAPGSRLHVMNRSPKEVEDSWRGRLAPEEVTRLDHLGSEVLAELESRRLPLSGTASH